MVPGVGDHILGGERPIGLACVLMKPGELIEPNPRPLPLTFGPSGPLKECRDVPRVS